MFLKGLPADEYINDSDWWQSETDEMSGLGYVISWKFTCSGDHWWTDSHCPHIDVDCFCQGSMEY